MRTLPTSNIEYLTHHWPIVTGCSFGCPYCYMKKIVSRFPQVHCKNFPFSNAISHPDRLDLPLRKTKPARIGVCFTGDLFDPSISNSFRDQVTLRMYKHMTPHAFFILTKRVEAMMAWSKLYADLCQYWPPHRVWFGTSITNQTDANHRIPILLNTPATNRWISIEPILGPIGLDCLYPALEVIDWIVIGAIDHPSPEFPAPNPQWINALVKQCTNFSIPVWVKNNARLHHPGYRFPQELPNFERRSE